MIDHVAAGRTRVELLAPSAPGALTGVASREVVLRDGETATVDFSLRDVVVAGSVTRGGQPAPGVRVSVRSLEGASTIRYGGPRAPALSWPLPVRPSWWRRPRRTAATSSLVFTPGRARVSLDSVAGNQRYPGREVDVPDVDRFELDLEIAETTVSGTVVDKDERRPGARTRASGSGARARGRGRTGGSRSRSSRGS